jgi:type II secretory pathway predicted ATPase ExeA
MPTRPSPYTPGAGAMPLVLAGREPEITAYRDLITRLNGGQHARGLLVTGLRGVGKTALLGWYDEIGAEMKWRVYREEFDSTTDLFPLLLDLAADVVEELSATKRFTAAVERFAGSVKKISVAGVGSVEFDRSQPRIDEANLGRRMTKLLKQVAVAAQKSGTGVIFLFDEMQELKRPDLAALLAAVHQTTQNAPPFAVVGAGLPPLAEQIREARAYAERLFEAHELAALDETAAIKAITEPARLNEAEFGPDAVELILERSDGYPHFLQIYADNAWHAATGDRIEHADVEHSLPASEKQIEREIFRPRFNQGTPKEREYMLAMARLGDGPQETLKIAKAAGYSNSRQTAVFREKLLEKHLIYSPDRGLLDFTIPHFARYLRSIGGMPEE